MVVNREVSFKDIKVVFLEFPEKIFYKLGARECIRYAVYNISEKKLTIRVFLRIGNKTLYGKWYSLSKDGKYTETLCFSPMDIKAGEQIVEVNYEVKR